MKWLSALLVSAACTAAGFALFWWMAIPREHGMFAVENRELAKLLIGFAATVAGVVLGSAYRHLARLKERDVQTMGSFRVEALNIARSVDLWMGLVASPLVYGLLIQSLAKMGLAGLVIVALENGFCCLLIAESFIKKGHATFPGT
jgi:hypothetical protein